MLPLPCPQLCEFLRAWSLVRGGMLGDYRGQEALLREAHGLLSAFEGRFEERQEFEMGNVEFALGRCLWTAGRGAEGEPLLRSLLRRRSKSTSIIARVQAFEYLADSALQRGDVDEAKRLCDAALALTGSSPDAFKLPRLPPTMLVSTWMECSAQALALRGSVEECRGNMAGAGRYDERARELVSTYEPGFPHPLDTNRRRVLRLLRGTVADPKPVAADIAAMVRGYTELYGDQGLNLFHRRKLEGWVRALRDCASALRARGKYLEEPGRKLLEAMEGEAADIEGIFDALKAAALAEARAAVAQERSSRQQRRAAEGALPQLPTPPAKLTKSQKKRARQKAARAAFVAGGGAGGDEASDAAAAADAAAAVGEDQEEGDEQGEEAEGQVMPPPVDTTAPVEECALCLAAMVTGDPSEAEAVVVGCGHQFHGMCMGMWTATCVAKGLPCTCPLCRHFL
jgi:hypothetical protein